MYVHMYSSAFEVQKQGGGSTLPIKQQAYIVVFPAEKITTLNSHTYLRISVSLLSHRCV